MLLRMFIDAATDIFRRLVYTETRIDLGSILVELGELRKYVNRQMVTIHERYGCVSMKMSDSWNWHRYPVVDDLAKNR